MVTEQALNDLKSLVQHFEARRTRASKRLAALPGKQWNFALVGLRTDINSMSFGELGDLRSVIEPPGEVELASALKDRTIFSAVSRYSHHITHELSINVRGETGNSFPHTVAWWIVSALRMKTLAEFLVPVAADHSWSVIAGISDQSCTAQLIEDVPRSRRVDAARMVREADVQWVMDHLTRFAKLVEVPRVRLAVEALTTHQHLFSPRMMAASIWAGIEALLDVKAELRFRLALLAACILEPRGDRRIETYRQMKKMYDVRSKAVHGVAMSEELLIAHIVEARRSLSDMLCKIVEAGKAPSEDDLEQSLLGE